MKMMPEKKIRVIINANDYEINRQIENVIRKGVKCLVHYGQLTNIEIFKKNGIVGDDGSYIKGAIFVTPSTMNLNLQYMRKETHRYPEWRSRD